MKNRIPKCQEPSEIPPNPAFQRGKELILLSSPKKGSPPFEKGRRGGFLQSLFQDAKFIPGF
jgi:hypothetical protein